MRFDRIVLLFLLCQLFPNEVCSQGSERVSMQCEVEDSGMSRRGPKGEIGPPGPPGLRGRRGQVDYETVSSTTDEKIISGIENLRVEMQEQIDQKYEKIQSLQEQLTIIFPNGPCDFVYKGICYWLEIHDSEDTAYEKAETICKERNSVLSYPGDETHYELIMKEMRMKIPSRRTSVYVWTGLRMNSSTDNATLATGEPAPYVKWYPYQPTRGAKYSRVYLYAKQDPASPKQGLYNDSLTSIAHGAMCQYKLFGEN